MKDNLTVVTLAMSNAVAAVAAKVHWIEVAQPFLQFTIGLGQVAVALLTSWYIWTKIKSARDKERKDED